MTVAELIEVLRTMPQHLEVVYPEEAWMVDVQPPRLAWITEDGSWITKESDAGVQVVVL